MPGVAERVESLLGVGRRDVFAELRSSPGAVGVETVLAELDKLAVLEDIGAEPDVFAGFSPQMVQRWHDRFAITRPSALTAIKTADRLLLARAWVVSRREAVIDGVVDLLIAVVHKIGAKAERSVERDQLADLQRVNGKTNMLYRLAEVVLANPDGVCLRGAFPDRRRDHLARSGEGTRSVDERDAEAGTAVSASVIHTPLPAHRPTALGGADAPVVEHRPPPGPRRDRPVATLRRPLRAPLRPR